MMKSQYGSHNSDEDKEGIPTALLDEEEEEDEPREESGMIHFSMGTESTRLLLTKTSSLLSDTERNDDDPNHNTNNSGNNNNNKRTSRPRQSSRRSPAARCGAGLLLWYQHELHERPVWTKSITSAILTGAGDLSGQAIQICMYNHDTDNDNSSSSNGTTMSLDWYRTLCFILLGLLVQAPLTHYYYDWLDRCFPPATTAPLCHRITWTKLAIDQLCWAPTITLAVFLFLDPLQGRAVLPHLQRDFGSTLYANWKLWFPSTLINLAFCPPAWRVLYCNVVFFVWSICLSIMLNNEG
mmetsp:Transcript_7564/g.20989  ORF Transcript_7564/g.20989 Transcript_7564/m.20989 type:complete len:296 (+) Transcript_7564:320-1207(+)